MTAALLLEIDPIGMVRNAKNFAGKDFLLGQYVNDRPYVASSFMSTAISKAFSSAMNGNCKEHPEYVDMPLALTAKLSVLPAPRGGEMLIKRLFEPLGYTVEAERHLLDTHFPAWGYGKYFTLTLKNTLPLKALLTHLYVLIPVLDNEKHYFITQDEVSKLMQKGKGWIEQHPERELIVSRYLINLKSLVRSAFEVLQAAEEGMDTEAVPQQSWENYTGACVRLVQSEKQKLISVTFSGITGACVRAVQPEKQPSMVFTLAGMSETSTSCVQALKLYFISVRSVIAVSPNLIATFLLLLAIIFPSGLALRKIPPTCLLSDPLF